MGNKVLNRLDGLILVDATRRVQKWMQMRVNDFVIHACSPLKNTLLAMLSLGRMTNENTPRQ
jgi:hypothetical protein